MEKQRVLHTSTFHVFGRAELCVCVCHTLFLRVFPITFPLFSQAGGCPTPEERASNKEALQVVLISARTLADVPALNFWSSCSTLGLFPWLFMLPPINPPFHRRCAAFFSRASETMLNTSSDRTQSPYCSVAILPIVATELTENQCQSVCEKTGVLLAFLMSL